VSSRFPVRGATGVRRGADVIAVVDERLRSSTVTRTSAYVVARGTTQRVRAQVTWDPVALRVVIDPNRLLRPATTYRVVVTTQVTDAAGNRLDQDPRKPGAQPATWTFTTR
jgi:hypothetical protein